MIFMLGGILPGSHLWLRDIIRAGLKELRENWTGMIRDFRANLSRVTGKTRDPGYPGGEAWLLYRYYLYYYYVTLYILLFSAGHTKRGFLQSFRLGCDLELSCGWRQWTVKHSNTYTPLTRTLSSHKDHRLPLTHPSPTLPPFRLLYWEYWLAVW